MKILLALTCYRCEKQIGRVLDKLNNFSLLSRINHIAIIDNKSPDNTVKNALAKTGLPQLKGKTYVYINDLNYGLGGSHKVAFDLAKKIEADYVFILHGDDQAEIDDLHKFFKHLGSNQKFSALLGSRFSLQSKLVGYQKKRILGNLILNVLYTFLSFRKVVDLGSGLNLYCVKDLEKISYHKLTNHFTFNSELMLNMFTHNMVVKFLPITWKEEDQQSNARNFIVAWEMIKTIFRWKFSETKKEEIRTYTTTLIE